MSIQFWTYVFLMWSQLLVFGVFDYVSGSHPRPDEQTNSNPGHRGPSYEPTNSNISNPGNNRLYSAQQIRNRRNNQPKIDDGNIPIRQDELGKADPIIDPNHQHLNETNSKPGASHQQLDETMPINGVTTQQPRQTMSINGLTTQQPGQTMPINGLNNQQPGQTMPIKHPHNQQPPIQKKLKFKICGSRMYNITVKENQPEGIAVTTVSAGYLDVNRSSMYLDSPLNNGIKYRIQHTKKHPEYPDTRKNVPNNSRIIPDHDSRMNVPNDFRNSPNLQNTHPYFSIDRNNGQITTLVSINRKDVQEIILTVIAEDNINPDTALATCTIRIFIEEMKDIIDKRPQISINKGRIHDHQGILETVNGQTGSKIPKPSDQKPLEVQDRQEIDQIVKKSNRKELNEQTSKAESPETVERVVETMGSEGIHQPMNKPNDESLTDQPSNSEGLTEQTSKTKNPETGKTIPETMGSEGIDQSMNKPSDEGLTDQPSNSKGLTDQPFEAENPETGKRVPKTMAGEGIDLRTNKPNDEGLTHLTEQPSNRKGLTEQKFNSEGLTDRPSEAESSKSDKSNAETMERHKKFFEDRSDKNGLNNDVSDGVSNDKDRLSETNNHVSNNNDQVSNNNDQVSKINGRNDSISKSNNQVPDIFVQLGKIPLVVQCIITLIVCILLTWFQLWSTTINLTSQHYPTPSSPQNFYQAEETEGTGSMEFIY